MLADAGGATAPAQPQCLSPGALGAFGLLLRFGLAIPMTRRRASTSDLLANVSAPEKAESRTYHGGIVDMEDIPELIARSCG